MPENLDKLTNLKMLVLAENNFRGDFPEAILNLPSLELVQLQNNRFGINDFNSDTAKDKLALFDFDGNKIRNFDVNKLNAEKDIRTADTRFEDGVN